MFFPTVWVKRYIRQHINGSLKYEEAPIFSDMVKAIPRVASFYVDPECITESVGASLMCMTRDTIFIFANKYRIVILGIFVQKFFFHEVRNNRTVKHSVFHQIGKNSANILAGFRQSKGF